MRVNRRRWSSAVSARRHYVALMVIIAVLGVACSGGGPSADGPGADAAPTSPTTAAGPLDDGPRSAPRWETVVSFSGTGPQKTPSFEIFADAIQWRVRWTCEAGALKVAAQPPPKKPAALVDAGCPGKGDGFAIHTGTLRLDVAATGQWEFKVDQQLDRALNEEPLPGMAEAPVLASGAFRDLEMTGKGTAKLFQLADGTRVLRLEDFTVSNNTDLFLRLSEAPDPATSADTVNSPFVEIGNLKSTVGNQNYVIPPDLPTERIRSVVIWCAPVAIAYIAASLPRS